MCPSGHLRPGVHSCLTRAVAEVRREQELLRDESVSVVERLRVVSPRPRGSLTRGEYSRIKKEVQDVIAKAEAEGRDVPSYADVLRSKLPFNHPSRLDPNGPLLICIA